MKSNTHINIVVYKAPAQICLINKCHVSLKANVLLHAYKIYVRPF